MGRKYHRKRRQPRRDRTTPAGEHLPVMLPEVVACLQPQPGQVIVDCTLGFAGHSAALLQHIGPTGRLIATDLDPIHLPRAQEKLNSIGHPFVAVHSNFAGLAGVLAEHGIEQVDGILADLGMSSMQVDDAERGFSYIREGPLDMRMDRSRGRTAAELLATLGEEELAQALTEYGDEPAAEAIAAAIIRTRAQSALLTTTQLRALIEQTAPVTPRLGPGFGPIRKQLLAPTTRVFQALRIVVNRELASLTHLLRLVPQVLKPGGRAAIISFHSGEDRLVKTTFRDGLRSSVYSAGSDEPIRPSEEEKLANPRSRSAKLRWVQRTAQPD